MQKKLRLRFLLICWGLLFAFLAAITAGISMYLYNSAVDGTEDALQAAAEAHALSDDTRGMAMVRLNEHGIPEETELLHLSISDETVRALCAVVVQDADQRLDKTELDGVRYRYYYIRYGGGAWVYIAECTQEQQIADRLHFVVPIFIALGGLLLIPVSILLSQWVSRPIETAWDKQSDFVSDATHELKTPLTVIAADTEAILSNPDATVESQERWLGSIQGETARMSELVQNLLFLAKIDAGEIKLKPEQIRLSDEVEGLCMEREAGIFESGRRFEYEMTPDLEYYGDRKRLEQMLAELLDNAEAYTPKNGEIRVVVNHDRRQHIRIVISNSGNEIPPEQLPKLFDRFYRADPSRSRETGGYGLGLCVARSIAVLHGGDITAESHNGVNVFTVTLGEVQDAEKDAHTG